MKKKLTLSNDKKISGVCAGIAEYFDCDPTLIRIIYAALTIFSLGLPGVLIYFLIAVIMPKSQA